MTVRVDVWLWSVRVFKTRTDATAACSASHVRINDTIVKPSRKVAIGDRVSARTRNGIRILEVVETPKKRIGAKAAALAFVDHSPPPPPKALAPTRQAVRDPGAGRPTKRDRRQLEKFRERNQG